MSEVIDTSLSSSSSSASATVAVAASLLEACNRSPVDPSDSDSEEEGSQSDLAKASKRNKHDNIEIVKKVPQKRRGASSLEGGILEPVESVKNAPKKRRTSALDAGGNAIPKRQRLLYNYDCIKSALIKFKEIYGHVLVKQDFQVPGDNSSWPEDTWGMSLGRVVVRIKYEFAHADKTEELSNIGLIIRVKEAGSQHATKELHGDVSVKHDFVVPRNSIEWSEEAWGMNLGFVVGRIKYNSAYKEKQEELIDMGFVIRPKGSVSDKQGRDNGYDRTKIALITFKELYGNLNINQDFLVPNESPNWPSETWGMKLGRAVAGIKFEYAHSSKADELRALGLEIKDRSDTVAFKPRREYGFDRIRIALLRYKELHGDLSVRHDFVVPMDSSDWPEETWGMRLENIVRNIRNGRTYTEKQEELVSLGLVIRAKDPDAPPTGISKARTTYSYERIKTALIKYKELNGDVIVPQTFKIPAGSAEWPEETWGIKLGRVVSSIRTELRYGNKQEELTSLGIVIVNKLGENSASAGASTATASAAGAGASVSVNVGGALV
mmetsp:Transcript_17261/g.16591  ORF Transcript_17261/g.16591 Transcript_17261/m.16591 type:complete len:551 (-) Transcript_17261:151-1803(-)|eukprot:CAMPEP_0119033284 /NCGR_PEP_ID=MMETSP1177-20130426/324_1 /TAXON_ID=2985 /ORGANISM="Ochromonas sp, Strain CCMP1899" /LENGTH=550 /DNA_ID=CAMNT_0006989913 /DNA_START=54 /DNA_END=1706 /DNA_ORIENTATION=-